MSESMTADDVDAQVADGCANPHCTHVHHLGEPLRLASPCHPGAGMALSYAYGSDRLDAWCLKCETMVASFRLARVMPLAARPNHPSLY